MIDDVHNIDASKPDTSSMAAFSDKRDGLFTALDMLYIYGNASGRNKFREKWPDVAAYVFGEQLIGFDNDGTTDFDLRKTLEEEADARRFFLKETIEDMVDKSVDAGMLQFDYVGKVVDAFGPLISTFLYSETVIERVRPGVLERVKADQVEDEEEEESVSAQEKEALTNTSDQILDDIQPIKTDTAEDDLEDNQNLSLDNDQLDQIVPSEKVRDAVQAIREIDVEASADSLFPEDADVPISGGTNPAPPAGEPLEPIETKEQTLAEEQPQPDEASPQQEEPQAEGSQSPTPPEGTTK